jgi:hypothetical protein
MDESLKTLIVVGGTILVAAVVHFTIIKRVQVGGKRSATFISRTLNSAKNPWRRESDQLDELARLVKQVSSNHADETEATPRSPESE